MAEEIISHQRNQKALTGNIGAAKALSDLIKTTLGPRGMDKMIVDGNGRVTVTNDGVTILDEMHIVHPAAILIADIAKTQEKEIGDGTTTVTMLTGELLKNAEVLIDKGIHPTRIIKGYAIAEKKAQEILKSLSIKAENPEILKKVAQTAMTGKGAEGYREHLAEVIVDAITIAQKEDILFNGIIGSPIGETRLIKGLVLDKDIPEGMPKELKNPKIALVDDEMDARKTEIDTSIEFDSFEKVKDFQVSEDAQFKEFADKIIKTKADIVFCTKSIHSKVLYYLSKAKIAAVRFVNKYDMDMLVKTTGAVLVSDLDDLTEGSLGLAGTITQKRYSDDDVKLFIEDCPKNAVTILVCSTSEHLLKEIKRAMTDGLGDVLACKDDYIVAGGGAVEIQLSQEIKKFARTLSGVSQLIVEKFADALEKIPETLAENSGLNSINMIADLHKAHASGEVTAGLNLFEDRITDTLKDGIVEPLKIKTLAISSATEVASQILRVDDLLMAKHE